MLPTASSASTTDYFGLIAPIQQFIGFLAGGWWEIAVALAARKASRFRDVRWSVEVERQPGSPVFEEDLLALDGLGLAVFSCKRGGDRARLLRAFSELDAGARTLGGSMTRRFLCVALPLKSYNLEEVRVRAAATQTTLVGPASRLHPHMFDPVSRNHPGAL
jgi:hypothetical protein